MVWLNPVTVGPEPLWFVSLTGGTPRRWSSSSSVALARARQSSLQRIVTSGRSFNDSFCHAFIARRPPALQVHPLCPFHLLPSLGMAMAAHGPWWRAPLPPPLPLGYLSSLSSLFGFLCTPLSSSSTHGVHLSSIHKNPQIHHFRPRASFIPNRAPVVLFPILSRHFEPLIILSKSPNLIRFDPHRIGQIWDLFNFGRNQPLSSSLPVSSSIPQFLACEAPLGTNEANLMSRWLYFCSGRAPHFVVLGSGEVHRGQVFSGHLLASTGPRYLAHSP